VINDWERDEWWRDVTTMSEADRERNADSHRAALGVVGDKYDDRYGGAAWQH
jgi:hypothetical protein